jgi:hypothetical protein
MNSSIFRFLVSALAGIATTAFVSCGLLQPNVYTPNKYAQQPVPISKTSGTHDLYMVFKGGVGIGTFTTFSF